MRVQKSQPYSYLDIVIIKRIYEESIGNIFPGATETEGFRISLRTK